MDPKVYFYPERIDQQRQEDIKAMREAATTFARVLRDLVPPCEDQRHCVLEFRKLVLLANQCISFGGNP